MLAALQLASSGGNELRASGTFPNPNMAGNLLALGLVCWSGAPFRWSVKVSVIGVALLGVLAAGSFGSMLQLGVGFGYLAISHIDQAKNLMRGRRLLAVIPLILVALIGFAIFANTRGGQTRRASTRTGSTASGGLRFELWQEAIERLPGDAVGRWPGIGARARR